MAKPSDREFILQRKIRELEEKNRQLEQKVAQLEKKKEREEPVKDKKKPKPLSSGECPDCGSPITVTELPFGKLQLCGKACGWRLVKNAKT